MSEFIISNFQLTIFTAFQNIFLLLTTGKLPVLTLNHSE